MSLPSNGTGSDVATGRSHPDGVYRLKYEFPFERDFSPASSTVWMQRYWTLAFLLSAIYVTAIYAGRLIMMKRMAFELRWPLILWNSALAIFSILGSLRMTPEFVAAVRDGGFEYSMCNASFAAGVSGFWTVLFAVSKVIEFGDTAFIVLRKRPVIFLHWYHHITVLLYTWHAFKEHTAGGRWFVWMNYTVHAFMYSYYALRSIGVKLPRVLAMCVTTLQIVQMIVGCVIAVNAYRIKSNGGFCQQSYENLVFSALIYGSYFWLFANFFYRVYLKRGGKHSTSVDELKKMN